MTSNRSPSNLLQVFLIAVLTTQTSGLGVTSKEHDLVNDLFANYNPLVRPVLDPTQSVQVKVSYYLLSLGDVDEKAQAISLHGFLQLTWTDEFLKWDPADYANIESIFMPPGSVWIPDLMFNNGIGDQFYNKDVYSPRIHSSGLVRWEVGGEIRILCDFEVHDYPFDDQECHMEVVSWAGTDDHMQLYGEFFDAKTYYLEHSDWKVYNTRPVNHSFIEGNDAYSEVHFYFFIERKVLSDMLGTVLPVLLISVLNGLVYLLPAESGEKVGTALTLLLTFTVLQYTIDQSIPSQSDSTPLLDMYVTMFMVCSGVTVLLAVYSVRMHHRPYPVTKTARHAPRTRLHSYERLFFQAKKLLYWYNKMAACTFCGPPRKVSAMGGEQKSLHTESQWCEVSYAFDRVCLILFFFIFILTSIIILVKIVNFS